MKKLLILIPLFFSINISAVEFIYNFKDVKNVSIKNLSAKCGASHLGFFSNINEINHLCSNSTPSVINTNSNYNWQCTYQSSTVDCQAFNAFTIENKALEIYRVYSNTNPDDFYSGRLNLTNPDYNFQYTIPESIIYQSVIFINHNTIEFKQIRWALWKW